MATQRQRYLPIYVARACRSKRMTLSRYTRVPLVTLGLTIHQATTGHIYRGRCTKRLGGCGRLV